jgi:hypothetical protein
MKNYENIMQNWVFLGPQWVPSIGSWVRLGFGSRLRTQVGFWRRLPITSYRNREVDYKVRDSDRILNSLVIPYESIKIVGYDIIISLSLIVARTYIISSTKNLSLSDLYL